MSSYLALKFQSKTGETPCLDRLLVWGIQAKKPMAWSFTPWRDPLSSVANFIHSEPDPNLVELLPLRLSLIYGLSQGRDFKIWRWSDKGFSVKSFYSFLNNGSTRCAFNKTLWKVRCSLKVRTFFFRVGPEQQNLNAGKFSTTRLQ